MRYFLTAYTCRADLSIECEHGTYETTSLTSALRWADERESEHYYVGVQIQPHDRAGLQCKDLAWLRNEEG